MSRGLFCDIMGYHVGGKVMARTFTQLTYEQRVQIKQML